MGTFEQRDHNIVGQLTLTTDCAIESNRMLKCEEVTEIHTDRKATAGWIVAGNVVVAIGVG